MQNVSSLMLCIAYRHMWCAPVLFLSYQDFNGFYLISQALCLIWTNCLCLSISWFFLISQTSSSSFPSERTSSTAATAAYSLELRSRKPKHHIQNVPHILVFQSAHFILHSFIHIFGSMYICVQQLLSKFNKSNWFCQKSNTPPKERKKERKNGRNSQIRPALWSFYAK